MKKLLILVVMLFSITVQAEEQDKVIHDELRQALQTVTDAINSGEYEKMLPVLSKDIKATPITQEFIDGQQQVVPYFQKWFGPERFLKKLNITFVPEVVTELSPDKTWGVVYGTGIEKYSLSDGRTYDFHTRWTATLAVEDGRWKIKAIHIGTDFMDNPLLNEARDTIMKSAIGGVVGGILLGVLFGFFVFRKKKR
ncbi:nuclear transport factor 2 family protein [Budviciaceae bacterium BWR-B9]|uniref:Nuclear transport factor 2 family protein n=1 Tax=Limnobaculum allomyrinae TaxID=2791986 RepID=A0ABS1IMJ3_9GAMM|nr:MULTISPECIES: nuclear transport factor 2 family protein [Limnobaculum]MBK5142952.1 nuclear transport factor 2 family protein [Limnobaculum allomyrinae]MBV7690161.1 nuclear transport factor 2 family protein [Limnobaculum sp. M2-1]